ncbi:AMP-binding protein [Nocardia transvalensis]|uniref:AMP-binding protein n=1 Tax=Nocardia transvalensis TaxID=37333 RepID=UPI002B4AF18D|nr:AMP-binding protein [Nocardia transvalensis]
MQDEYCGRRREWHLAGRTSEIVGLSGRPGGRDCGGCGAAFRRSPRGDRVAVSIPNCVEFPVAYYGIQLAGAAFVPVNPLLPADRIAAQVADADAALRDRLR